MASFDIVVGGNLFNAANISPSSTSAASDVSHCMLLSVQSTISGSSPNGTLKIQASNDNVNWSDLHSDSVTGNATLLYTDNNPSYQFIRAKWTYASGSGTITNVLCGKGPT